MLAGESLALGEREQGDVPWFAWDWHPELLFPLAISHLHVLGTACSYTWQAASPMVAPITELTRVALTGL